MSSNLGGVSQIMMSHENMNEVSLISDMIHQMAVNSDTLAPSNQTNGKFKDFQSFVNPKRNVGADSLQRNESRMVSVSHEYTLI